MSPHASRHPALALAPVLAVLHGGCNSSELDTLDDFAKERASIECGRAFSCCDARDRSQVVPLRPMSCDSAATVSECASLASPDWYAVLRAPAARGRFVFHPEAARRCVARLRGLSCGDYFTEGPDPEECGAALEGLLAEGDACNDSFECAGAMLCRGLSTAAGGVCSPPPTCSVGDDCGAGRICDGWSCVDPLPPGSTCSSDRLCVAEDYCNVLETTRVCAPRRPVGGTCGESRQCAAGLYCAVSNPPAGTCATLLGLDQPCDDADACVVGLYCAATGVAPSGKSCRPAQADGASCRDDRECASGGCNRDEAQATTWIGVCGPPVPAPTLCGGSRPNPQAYGCPWV